MSRTRVNSYLTICSYWVRLGRMCKSFNFTKQCQRIFQSPTALLQCPRNSSGIVLKRIFRTLFNVILWKMSWRLTNLSFSNDFWMFICVKRTHSFKHTAPTNNNNTYKMRIKHTSIWFNAINVPNVK